MATHSSVLAWRIPGMVEPDGLPSMGSHRVGHDWSDLAAAAQSVGSQRKSDTTEHGAQYQRKLTSPGTPHRLSAHRSEQASLVCLQRSRGRRWQHAKHGGLWARSGGLIQLRNEQGSSPHQLPGTAGLRVLSGAVAPPCVLRWSQKKQEVKVKVSLPGWGQS